MKLQERHIHDMLKQTFEAPVFIKNGDFYRTFGVDIDVVQQRTGIEPAAVYGDVMIEIPEHAVSVWVEIEDLDPILIENLNDPYGTFHHYGQTEDDRDQLTLIEESPLPEPQRNVILPLESFRPNHEFWRQPPTEEFIEDFAIGQLYSIIVTDPGSGSNIYEIGFGQGRVWAARTLNERLGTLSPYWEGIRADVYPIGTNMNYIRIIENKVRDQNILSDLLSFQHLLADGKSVKDVVRLTNYSERKVRSILAVQQLVPALRQKILSGMLAPGTAMKIAAQGWNRETQLSFIEKYEPLHNGKIIANDIVDFRKVDIDHQREFFDNLEDEIGSLDDLRNTSVESVEMAPVDAGNKFGRCLECGGFVKPSADPNGFARVGSAEVRENAATPSDEDDELLEYDEVTIRFLFRSPSEPGEPFSITFYTHQGLGAQFVEENFHIQPTIK